MTWTDANVNYIVHSIRVFSTNSSTILNSLSNAVSNAFAYWGDGIKNSTDACDDYNLVSGDGWTDTWTIEPGYGWAYSSTSLYQDWDLWGNSIKFVTEYWDDGNLINGDGWNSSWYVENGWYCSVVGTISKWGDYWGDGKNFNLTSTYWDDGNIVSGDGWSSSWSKETGWVWSGGSSTNKDTWTDNWGDGKKYTSLSTFWDDGNTASGDGCSSTWSIETGWMCSGGSSTSKDVWNDICADGKKYTTQSTFWDDGSIINGDGCSSTWNVETGYSWTGGSSTSKDTCSEVCGDGIRFNYITTYCDDGNKISGDGWSSSWVRESGWIWSGGSTTSMDVWIEIWADGVKFNGLSTYCDDGNIYSGDGWSIYWSVESGWSCTGGTSATKDTCAEIWGDGMRINTITTYWDDGNSSNGDGWSSSWGIETGWLWSGGTISSADTWTEIWGDGKKFNSLSTYWDDGNKANGDGCNSSWSIESGWTWSGGTTTIKDTCTEICGDGTKFSVVTTYWDDGNKINGDGCSNSWSIESGWSCTGGSISSKDTCSEIWGDGNRFNSLGTYWDDGNKVSGDGWSSTCAIEVGWLWSGGSTTIKDVWNEIWGDGKRFNSLTSYCDDGNSLDGDGCSLSCSTESGWNCSGGNSSAKDTWSEIWGDGVKFNALSTYWDDGNTKSGDGWNSSWVKETGWTWINGSSKTPDVCTEIWGDGKRFNSLSTYWDDGNIIDGDGWSSSCLPELGFTWSGGSSTKADVWGDICGDGIKISTLSTFWDDGNTVSKDGWSSTCNIESGWTWIGGTSTTKDIWTEICGDGKRFNTLSTYCDDGNNLDGDGCSSTWSVETSWTCSGGSSVNKDIWGENWGDGIRLSTLSTVCDDGNTINGDGCNSKWSIESGWNWSGWSSTSKDICTEICGDGKRFNSISTYCDDGNLLNGDGWNSSWSIESGWTWLGGTTSLSDTWVDIWGDGKKYGTVSTKWDDGNLLSGDGCSSSCNIETGWTWLGGSNSSTDSWNEICGDGKKFNAITTYWDDGNIIDGDGCSSIWAIESGYECKGGNSASKDIWVKIIKVLSSAAVATQATAGVGVGVSAGSSLLSMSSPAAIFVMINQFQMLLLLPLTGAYISDQVLFTITGMTIALFNFDFIRIEKIQIIYHLFDFLSINQQNSNMTKIGIISGNTLIN